jgi:stage II sporulation protein M
MQTILTALRMLRVYLILAAAVFLGGALTGILLRELPEAMVQPLYELARELRDKPWFIMTLFLLCKNALAALVAILGGFLLGVLPFMAALTNGMVLGRVLADQPSAIALILPHGVFELPAVAIAWGAGLWCAGWLRCPPRAVRLRQRAATSLRLFVKLILPLLAVAAAIEATGIKWLTAS